MNLTFGEVQNSDIQNVVSCAPTSPDFRQYVKAAIERLLPRGDWAGTVVPIHTCVNRGCVVWPCYVDHVRYLSHCGRNIPTHGMFYEMLDWQDPHWRREIALHGHGRRNLVNQGWTPVYQDILGPGRNIRLYHTASEDIGATVTIFGKDNNNQTLRTRNLDGVTWSEGITLTAQYPYAESAVQVLHIERVVRSKTQNVVRLFGVTYPVQNVFPQQLGYVYNLDTGQFVSLTILGNPGAEFIQLATGTPPVNAAQIGYLYNYDVGQWRPVYARGQSPNFYLDFEQPTAINSVYGGTAYNLATLAWRNIVLRGTIGSQYADVGDVPAPTTVLSGTASLEPIAEYEPSDTNPKFVKSSLYLPQHIAPPGQGTPLGAQPACGIVALVKLRQITPFSPNDLIVLPSLQAIKLGVQAIMAGEANEFETEREYIAAAVEQLNRELEDWLPLNQIPVDLGELGHADTIGLPRMF